MPDKSLELPAFFKAFPEINANALARRLGIDEGLFRQYASGVKKPGAARLKKIQDAINQLADELRTASF